MTVPRLVLLPGRTIENEQSTSGKVRCPVCSMRVLTQPFHVRDEARVKHYDAKEREHLIGTLEQLDGKWFVREALPPKRQRKLKSTYPSVFMPVVVNNVGRGKRQ